MKPPKAPRQSRPITLATVARLAGVSPSTVSLVLNDRPLARNLTSETRERIRAAAAKLHYRPNAAARSLRSARTQLIGIIVFDIADPYCTLILQGVQETLGQSTFLPIILDVQNRKQQFERYLGMVVEHNVGGLIIVANWLYVDLDILHRFESNGIPAVIVGREFPSHRITSVLVDNEAGGYEAMRHLVSLGHRRIAVIRGPERLQDSDRRWRGMQRAARDCSITFDTALIAQLPETADPLQGYAGGYDATCRMLDRKLSFTGVLAFDDLTACGVIRALHNRGLRVPDDVSVVGFDDIPNAVLTTPSLSTVSQHMKEMGKFATEHVLQLIEMGDAQASAPAFIRLQQPAVVRRESTAPNRNGDSRASANARQTARRGSRAPASKPA